RGDPGFPDDSPWLPPSFGARGPRQGPAWSSRVLGRPRRAAAGGRAPHRLSRRGRRVYLDNTIADRPDATCRDTCRSELAGRHLMVDVRLAGIGMTSARTRDPLVQRLRAQGISNLSVLDRIRNVPRHIFIDEALGSRAYEDTALPIGFGQTISQPYIVARMAEAL